MRFVIDFFKGKSRCTIPSSGQKEEEKKNSYLINNGRLWYFVINHMKNDFFIPLA